MTVEELMEILQRCDKHKPVIVSMGGFVFEIDMINAKSPASVSSPLEITVSATGLSPFSSKTPPFGWIYAKA